MESIKSAFFWCVAQVDEHPRTAFVGALVVPALFRMVF